MCGFCLLLLYPSVDVPGGCCRDSSDGAFDRVVLFLQDQVGKDGI